MARQANNFDYAQKSAELEALLARLQDPTIQIDEATKLHATGVKLVEEIEAYLKQAENEVRKHTVEG